MLPLVMPRQARLDAPDTLHHVMVRGIERTALFRDDVDRADFITRLASLVEAGAWTVSAWALLPNHAHLLVRTGSRPLPRSMRALLTGYAGAFNRRHKRVGHLFQNRYKSIVVEAEFYLLELVRYVHLNPLRAKVVPDLRRLGQYPWTGHSALLGTVPRPWQDTRTILRQFGPTPARARTAYRAFVAAGVPRGRRPEFQGGASCDPREAGPPWPPSAGGGRPTVGMSGSSGAPTSWRRCARPWSGRSPGESLGCLCPRSSPASVARPASP